MTIAHVYNEHNAYETAISHEEKTKADNVTCKSVSTICTYCQNNSPEIIPDLDQCDIYSNKRQLNAITVQMCVLT